MGDSELKRRFLSGLKPNIGILVEKEVGEKSLPTILEETARIGLYEELRF